MKNKKNKVGILIFGPMPKDLDLELQENRFAQEIRKKDLEPEIFYSDLFAVCVAKNKLDVFYRNKKIDLKRYKFFISRYGINNINTFNRLSIARFLQQVGVKIFNSPQAAFLAKNKRDSLFTLSQNKLPITPFGINYSPFFLDQHLINNKNQKIVAKLNSSSLGYAVSVLDSPISFVSFMEFVSGGVDPSGILIQPYIESNAEDYRIFVVGNKIVAGMKRKANGIEFRANIAKGGVGEKIIPTKKMSELAVKATKVLGLDYAGVDIIKDKKGKLMIVEVNANPQLKIEEITGVNVVGEIVKYCVRKSS